MTAGRAEPCAGQGPDVWDPEEYGRFEAERTRPFRDLLAAVPLAAPRRVVDLGCGTGRLTAMLAARWPDALVTGIDSSTRMLAAAAAHALPDRLEFRLLDVRDWQPAGTVDLVVSNAALQWLPGHLRLLPRLAGALGPGGVLALAVPGNFDSPSHALLREACGSTRWRHRLESFAASRSVAAPAEYLAVLAQAGLRPDVWETTYLHRLHGGANPVLDWMRGTALRPVLAALPPAARAEFLADYGARLLEAYPAGGDAALMPFRRIFAVGQRPD